MPTALTENLRSPGPIPQHWGAGTPPPRIPPRYACIGAVTYYNRMVLPPEPPATPLPIQRPDRFPSMNGTRMSEMAAPSTGLWRQRLRRFVLRRRGAFTFVGGISAALVAVLIYQSLVPGAAPVDAERCEHVGRAGARLGHPAAGLFVARLPGDPPVLHPDPGARGRWQAATDGGLGSGVIVSDRGDILTSLHVVAGAPRSS